MDGDDDYEILVLKPFPSKEDHLKREREKVNDIIFYFNDIPLPSSFETGALCQRSLKNIDGKLWWKITFTIAKISCRNARSSIQSLTEIIDEVLPIIQSPEDDSNILLEILYFIRGFLYDLENDPNEAIKNYLRCLEIIVPLQDHDNILNLELLFLVRLFFKDAKNPIIRDNFDRIKSTFENALPKMPSNFKPFVISIILGEGFIEQKNYHLARIWFAKALNMSKKSPDCDEDFILSLKERIAYCNTKLGKFKEAYNIISKSFNHFDPLPLSDADSSELIIRLRISNIYFQLNEPDSAFKIIKHAIHESFKINGTKYLTCYPLLYALMILCGFETGNEETVALYTKEILPSAGGFPYVILAQVLKNQGFQANVIRLMNILHSRIKPQTKSRKKKKSQSTKTVSIKDLTKTFRLFKNTAFICYLSRKILD